MEGIYEFKNGKNTWGILVNKNYTHIIKTSLPRHMQMGKTFQNIQVAQESYKDASLKAFLFQIECGLAQPVELA